MRVKILNVACAARTIQKLIAVPRTAGRFLSLLVQRKKPKKARPGWRDLSRYTSGSAGKSGAHIPVRLFALPLAALSPALLAGIGARLNSPGAKYAPRAQTRGSLLPIPAAMLGRAIRGFEHLKGKT